MKIVKYIKAILQFLGFWTSKMKINQYTSKELAKFQPNNKWVGYLWYDNQEKPEVFAKATPINFENKLTKLPFVVEGYLYCKNKKCSITIHHYNGEYCIHIVTNIDETQGRIRIDQQNGKFPEAIKALRFLEVFGAVEDVLNSDFNNYQFLYKTFTGYVR